MIAKTAFSENIISKNKDNASRMNTGMFFLSFIFLIFRENMGIFDTIKKEIKMENININIGSFRNLLPEKIVSE